MKIERRPSSPGKVFVGFSRNDFYQYNNGTTESDAVVAISEIKTTLKHGTERSYDPNAEEWILEDTEHVREIIEDIRFRYFEDKDQIRMEL